MKKLTSSYFGKLYLCFLVNSLFIVLFFYAVAYISFNTYYTEAMEGQGYDITDHVTTEIDSAIQEYTVAIELLAQDDHVLSYLSNDTDKTNVLKTLYALHNNFTRPATISVISVNSASYVSTNYNYSLSVDSYLPKWGIFRKLEERNGETTSYAVSKDILLDAETRICVAKSVTIGENQGYILVEVPRSTLAQICTDNQSVFTSELMILNNSGAVIFHSGGEALEGLYRMNQTETADSMAFSPTDYVSTTLEDGEIQVMWKVPQDGINQLASVIGTYGIIGLLLCLLINIPLALLLTSRLSKPIKALQTSMEQVQNGDLDAKVKVTSNDEIGHLGQAFNSMTFQINKLVHDIKEQQESLRISEAKALSLQVNPHFIYNTLDLIKWSARLEKPEVVSGIAISFGRILRRILNNKEDFVPLEYEMNIVEDYINIQKHRYADRLQVRIKIPFDVLDEKIPKLLLQPLVENAIIHGIESKVGFGKIGISSKIKGDYIRIYISDNGVGMNKDVLSQVKEFKDTGMYKIGLQNVNQRAIVNGDETCGLRIKSIEGKGSCVVLTVKRI